MMRSLLSVRTATAALLALAAAFTEVSAQCPTVLGPSGAVSSSPTWSECTGNGGPLYVHAGSVWSNLTVDWGDGSAPESFSAWSPATGPLTHSYPAGNAVYTVRFMQGSCTVEGTHIVEQPTNASIQIPFGGVTQACAPATLEFFNSSTQVSATTQFTWNFGDGSPEVTYNHTNSGETVSHTFQSGSVNCETEVTLRAENYCNSLQGGPSQAHFNPIMIWDRDEASIDASATMLCWPNTGVTVSNATVRNCTQQGNGGQRFEYWNFGDLNLDGVDEILDWNATPPNGSSHALTLPAIGSYTVMMIDSSLCGLDTAYRTIHVLNGPSGYLTASTQMICEDLPVQFTQHAGGVQYKWNFGTGANFMTTATGNVSFTFVNPGTYTVTSVVLSGMGTSACTDTSTVTITVLPRPAATMTITPSSICGTSTVSVTGNSPDGASYAWGFGPAPYVASGQTVSGINYTTPGTHTMTMIVTGTNGCTTTKTGSFVLHALPAADFAYGTLCEGAEVQFTDLSVAPTGQQITSWNWNLNPGTSFSQHPESTYPSPGEVPVSLTVHTATCSSTVTKYLTIHENPTVTLSVEDGNGCAPLLAQLDLSGSPLQSVAWNFGDGSSTPALNASEATSIDHLFEGSPTEHVTYTIAATGIDSHGCQSTATASVTAKPSPVAAFTTNVTSGCAPIDLGITNASVGAAGYAWDLDEGLTSTVAAPDLTLENTSGFLQYRTLELVALASNGCHDTTAVTVSVFPEPDFSFDLPSAGVCSPLELTMPPVFSAASFHWNFGDGSTSTETQPTHVWNNTGYAALNQTVTFSGVSAFGCVDSHSQTVTILPQPTADFSAIPSGQCSPMEVELLSSSTHADALTWQFSDGATSTAPHTEHTFEATGSEPETVQVTLLVSHHLGCTAERTWSTTVAPQPEYTLALETTSACSPLEITLPEIQGATGGVWNFGDGTISTEVSPTHAWTNTTGDLVSYMVTFSGTSPFGCVGTGHQQVFVKPQPVAEFSVSALTGCAPFAPGFSHASTLADFCSWLFVPDAASGLAPIVASTTAAGIPNVQLTAGSQPTSWAITMTASDLHGCTDEDTAVLTVWPEADFAFSVPATAACSPFTWEGTPLAGASGTWNFGDGSTSSTPVHTWSNTTGELETFSVSFTGTTTFGCPGSHTETVHVRPQPTLTLVASELDGCGPFAVDFLPTTTFTDGIDWNFGDGTTATTSDAPVSHEFAASSIPVARTVTVTAWDALGCTTTETLEILVYPVPDFTFSLPETPVCSPLEVVLPAIPAAAGGHWNFGDGTEAGLNATTHTWTANSQDMATFEVSFTGVSHFGCEGTHTAEVRVLPQPELALLSSTEAGCGPLEVVFEPQASFADGISWSFGDGTTEASGSEASVLHTFEPGVGTTTYTATATAWHSLGCSTAVEQTIAVFPIPEFSFEVPAEAVCSPWIYPLPAVDGAVDGMWTLSDEWTSENPVNEVVWNNTTGDLELVILSFSGTDAQGCTGRTEAEVAVRPQPEAAFVADQTAGCSPLVVYFSNSSTQADTYTWTFGNGQTTGDSDPHYTFVAGNTPTVHTVTLVATDDLGCTDETTLDITVRPAAEAAFSGVTSGCSPFSTTLVANTAAATSWEWTLDNGATDTGATLDLVVTATGSEEVVTGTMTATNMYGCSDETPFEVQALPAPVAGLGMDLEQACAGTPIDLHSTAEGTVSVSFSDGTPDWTPNAPGHHTVSFTAGADPVQVTVVQHVTNGFGCADSVVLDHIVLPAVHAELTLPEPQCSPFTATLANLSTQADAYTWSFSNGTVSNAVEPTLVFEATGASDEAIGVELLATNAFGCSDTVEAEVLVWGRPEAIPVIDETTGCYPLEVSFSNHSSGAAETLWAFGDGTTSNAPDATLNHVYYNPSSNPVVYTATLTVTTEHGCTDSDALAIEVSPVIEAEFDAPAAGCSPLNAAFINQSEGAVSYVWDFGDGTTSTEAHPTHTFTNLTTGIATFPVQLVATSASGCTDTVLVGVDVNPMPFAQFSVGPYIQTWPNGTVTLDNLSQGTAGAVTTWFFGDGTTSTAAEPGTHSFPTWGTYSITLDVDAGQCGDAATQVVSILPPVPTAAFTGGGEGCAPLSVSFTNESTFATGYLWDFGDGAMTTESSPVHVYETPGVYNVRLIALGHSGDEAEVIQYATVEVFPTPAAAFTFTPDQVVAPNEPVVFINLSDDGATSFAWNFGDGHASNLEHPTHTYREPGTYTVQLTVSNELGCSSTLVHRDAVIATTGGYMTFPTAFTPDPNDRGDGSYQLDDLDNNVFHPQHAGIVDYELMVFNKWGEMLFLSRDPMIGWNGYTEQGLVRQDVYVYKATARFSDGRKVQQSGDVMVILQ
ncbi:MAG: PKD domain-containing protein [Flavobacteriales bacterium]